MKITLNFDFNLPSKFYFLIICCSFLFSKKEKSEEYPPERNTFLYTFHKFNPLHALHTPNANRRRLVDIFQCDHQRGN